LYRAAWKGSRFSNERFLDRLVDRNSARLDFRRIGARNIGCEGGVTAASAIMEAKSMVHSDSNCMIECIVESRKEKRRGKKKVERENNRLYKDNCCVEYQNVFLQTHVV
jgi:hypothetical protein